MRRDYLRFQPFYAADGTVPDPNDNPLSHPDRLAAIAARDLSMGALFQRWTAWYASPRTCCAYPSCN